MPRIPSLPHSIITAQLNRVTSLSGLVPYSTLRKSAISKEMARDTFASTKSSPLHWRSVPHDVTTSARRGNVGQCVIFQTIF